MKGYSDSISNHTEDDIIKMLKFLVDDIFVVSGGEFPTDCRYCARVLIRNGIYTNGQKKGYTVYTGYVKLFNRYLKTPQFSYITRMLSV